MSNRLRHAIDMKIKKSVRFRVSSFNLIYGVSRHIVAAFVTARLIRKSNDRHEITGGTPSEHSAAREWCSLFAPEIVFTSAPQAASPARHRCPMLHALAV